MAHPALEIHGLRKTFYRSKKPAVEAVRQVTLEVARGEIFGFLGPNGAGKTTTVHCALGLLPLDAGTIRLLGRPATDRRTTFRRVGYCPDSFCLPGELTAVEHLSLFTRLTRLSPIARRKRRDELIERFGLRNVADRPAGQLSLGEKQRLLIAQALVHDPDLLFLDEPTQGLDPIGLAALRELLRDRAARGATLFINSHQLSEVEKLCDRVGILIEGNLVRQDALYTLLETGDMESYFIDVVKGG